MYLGIGMGVEPETGHTDGLITLTVTETETDKKWVL